MPKHSLSLFLTHCSELNKFELLVVVDVPTPSAQFGYKDVPSQLVQLPPVSESSLPFVKSTPLRI